jgi:chemotaxis protein methyltransferase CheR
MTISRIDFEYMRDLVRERSSIVIDAGKEYLVESRLHGLARQEGLAGCEDLINAIRRDPRSKIADKAVEAMTTNETSFFRDIHPFETLRDQVLPAVITARAAKKRIEIWSAASSSGQEAYSLAITVREHFPQLASWNVRITATDLSSEMVQRCRAGRFTQLEVNRGLPAASLVRHFRREAADWVAGDDLRKLIECREMNLTKPWLGLPRFDIVFLRNVLIYFDAESRRQTLQRLMNVMQPDGYVFFGVSETGADISDFERVKLGRSICFRPRANVVV